MSVRKFVDFAPQTTLPGSIDNVQTSFAVASLAGFPSALPYEVTLDINTASAEQILVTGVSGTTVTVTRNSNSTGAFTHPSNATFTHTAGAINFSEANAHINAGTGVHGITGQVVGTTDAQTLSNKTFAALSLNNTSGVTGITANGDGTGPALVAKNGSTTVAEIDGAGNISGASLNVSSGTVQAASLITSGDAQVDGDGTIVGNLTVDGTLFVSNGIQNLVTYAPLIPCEFGGPGGARPANLIVSTMPAVSLNATHMYRADFEYQDFPSDGTGSSSQPGGGITTNTLVRLILLTSGSSAAPTTASTSIADVGLYTASGITSLPRRFSIWFKPPAGGTTRLGWLMETGSTTTYASIVPVVNGSQPPVWLSGAFQLYDVGLASAYGM